MKTVVWSLFLPLPLLLAIFSGWWLTDAGLLTPPKRVTVLPPSTALCDPAAGQACAMVEYLSYHQGAFGSVFVGGVLSHCQHGFCAAGQPYQEIAPYQEPVALTALVGCPDVEDGEQAMAIVREWEAAGSHQARMAIPLVGACDHMSKEIYYNKPPLPTLMPLVTVTASRPAYSYGGPGVEARAEGNARVSQDTLGNNLSAAVQGALTLTETLLYGEGVEGMVAGTAPMDLMNDPKITQMVIDAIKEARRLGPVAGAQLDAFANKIIKLLEEYHAADLKYYLDTAHTRVESWEGALYQWLKEMGAK